MGVYLFKLKFKGPSHFGETGIDLENVSERVCSDTLFSALVNAYKELHGIKAATEFVETYKESPQFILSSLFVYSEDEYFLPKPLDDSKIKPELKKESGKDLKKLKWLNVEGFQKWMSGNIDENDIAQMKEINRKYHDVYIIEIRPRVTLDRITSRSNIYHSGFLYFKKNTGLYGFVIFTDTSFITKFKSMLTILGDIGLGGERTYGCGRFDVVEFSEIPDNFKSILFKQNDRYVLLSLYHPDESNYSNLKNGVSYDFVRKRGWITSGRYAFPYKRKSVGFFIEGSVFKSRPIGTLVDVTPDGLEKELPHKIYRNGYAFSIPINWR